MRIFPEDHASHTPRWLLVSADSHPAAGGIGAYVWNLTHVAVAAGWEVHLVTRSNQPHPQGAIVHLVDTPDTSPGFDRRIPALRAIEKIRPYRYGLWSLAVAERLAGIRIEVDAIEFPDSRPEGIVSLTSDVVRQAYPTTPMLIHAHAPMSVIENAAGASPDRYGRAMYHEWERVALQHADVVMASSSMMVDALQLDRSITRVPPPLLPTPVAPIAELLRPRILFVGAVQPGKGVEVWMRSLNDVLSKHRNVEARIVGRDTMLPDDGGSTVSCALNVARPDVRRRITWVGPCSARETAAEISLSSLVVVPSRFESFSYAGAEALMQGRAVIITDCVGLGEYAPDLPIVPAGDHVALAEAQCAALDNLDRARNMALRSRARLAASCASGLVIAGRLRALKSVVPGRAPSSDDDGIATMRDLLESIEAEERGQDQANNVCA